MNKCKVCNGILAKKDTVWVNNHGLFCSTFCGVSDALKLYEPNEGATVEDAKAYFMDISEEVDLETIGIETTVWTAYSEDADVTTIFKSVKDGDTNVYDEVIGFYFGKPNDKDTEVFQDSLTAVFVED